MHEHVTQVCGHDQMLLSASYQQVATSGLPLVVANTKGLPPTNIRFIIADVVLWVAVGLVGIGALPKLC